MDVFLLCFSYSLVFWICKKNRFFSGKGELVNQCEGIAVWANLTHSKYFLWHLASGRAK